MSKVIGSSSLMDNGFSHDPLWTHILIESRGCQIHTWTSCPGRSWQDGHSLKEATEGGRGVVQQRIDTNDPSTLTNTCLRSQESIDERPKWGVGGER